ncbi:hypothetical protein HAX54_027660, partial [Datura stramonium]|nr:hypothetical protein [Datura stramonium]
LVLAACVYNIWIEMNNIIFKMKRVEPQVIKRRIVQDVFYRGSMNKKVAKKLEEMNFYP